MSPDVLRNVRNAMLAFRILTGETPPWWAELQAGTFAGLLPWCPDDPEERMRWKTALRASLHLCDWTLAIFPEPRSLTFGILAEKQAGQLSELSEKELQKRIAVLED